jgi:hypothetical protein
MRLKRSLPHNRNYRQLLIQSLMGSVIAERLKQARFAETLVRHLMAEKVQFFRVGVSVFPPCVLKAVVRYAPVIS